MANLEQAMRKIRPSLRIVAPLTYYICWGYALVNILIGIGLFLLQHPAAPIAVAEILSYKEWGFIFIAIGVIGLHGLLGNRWNLTRNVLLAGILVKSIWMIALIVRSIIVPETTLITAVWIFLAYVQVLTYIFFIPKFKELEND